MGYPDRYYFDEACMPMTELFLIAHKVSGEAAFDVATKMSCPECNGKPHCGPTDDVDSFIHSRCLECDAMGYWWIIPTSGHRAYPYWHAEIIDNGVDIGLEWTDRPASPPPMPTALPDHYRHGPAPKVDIKALFKKSDWVPNPEAFIKRRL